MRAAASFSFIIARPSIHPSVAIIFAECHIMGTKLLPLLPSSEIAINRDELSLLIGRECHKKLYEPSRRESKGMHEMIFTASSDAGRQSDE
jgi:hypothetical protein